MIVASAATFAGRIVQGDGAFHRTSTDIYGVILMSNNPFQSPLSKDTMAGSSEYARSKVKTPAIALLVAMSIGMVLVVISLLMNLLGAGLGAAAAGTDQGMMNLMSGTVGIVSGLIGLAIGGVIIFGSLKMMKLESHGLAMTSAILAMLPCISPCCFLGLPFGIWALIVLSDAQVKASFR